jgi:hypothetical protein
VRGRLAEFLATQLLRRPTLSCCPPRLNASVELIPCMNVEEFKTGLAAIG